MTQYFPIIVEQESNGAFSAWVAGLPGVYAAADTLISPSCEFLIFADATFLIRCGDCIFAPIPATPLATFRFALPECNKSVCICVAIELMPISLHFVLF